MFAYRYWIATLILAASPAFSQTGATKTISGVVVDESGTPLAGATVYYRNSPTSVRDKTGHTRVTGATVESSVITGKDGTFSLTGLPSSVYWLCAWGTLPTHIRSCEWGFGSTKVDLTAASTAANTKLQVHDGVALTFQVNDVRNQIKEFAAVLGTAAPPGNFRIFVVSGTWSKPVPSVSTSGNTHQYSIVVPKSHTVRLLLDTRLAVANQAQSAELTGKPGDTITTGAQPLTYYLTIP